MKKTAAMVVLGLVGLPGGGAGAQELPATLQVVGAVSVAAGTVGISLRGARVLVIEKNTGNEVGSASVIDESGLYVVEMLREKGFNGRVLAMRIVHDSRTYDLFEGARAAEFPFSGSFPFPTRVTKNVTVHLKTAAAPAAVASRGHRYDVTGDGVFDEKDIERMLMALAGDAGRDSYDVNSDGVFNSLDIVEARRALARKTL